MAEKNYAAHGGDIYRNTVKLDFSVNLNPLGMPEEVKKALREDIPSWSVYPDPECGRLKKVLAGRLCVDEKFLLFGNGAAELIYSLAAALRPKKALIFAPTFSEYEAALAAVGCDVTVCGISARNGFCPDASAFSAAVAEGTDLVFLCNPNNPTGRFLKKEEVRQVEEACRKRQAVLCVDECFVNFLDHPEECSVVADCEKNPRLIVLRAFTKTFALAGLRLGYLVTADEDLLAKMRQCRQPWSVSAPAVTAGLAALLDVPASYLTDTRNLLAAERPAVEKGLTALGYRVFPSETNFILFEDLSESDGILKTPGGDGPSLYLRCLAEGFLIRDCSNFYGLTRGFYRIGLHEHGENERLLDLLSKLAENNRKTG